MAYRPLRPEPHPQPRSEPNPGPRPEPHPQPHPEPHPEPRPGPNPEPNGFSALADPTRRRIFERVAAGPTPVGEVAKSVPVSRPAVSQHLKVLKEAGLVVDRRVGNRSIYQVNPDGVRAMHVYLEQFWKQAMAAFKVAVDQQPGSGGDAGGAPT